MRIDIQARGGDRYWIDSEDKDFDRILNRILSQTGGWVMLNKYVDIGNDLRIVKHLVPCHNIVDVGPHYSNDSEEFERLTRSRIWY